jgi:hypothetical protein
MKLGKLLGAGRSIFGWQESLTYRANKHVYLPKFNPGENPFHKKSKEVESSIVAAPCTVAVKPVVEEKVQVAKAPVAKLELVSAPVPAPPKVEPVRAQANWTEKLNPFRAAKPAKTAPPAPMPNVQVEMSLSDVKVMHNDLSDAEVEVVPMKSRVGSSAPEPKPTMTSVPMEFLGEPVMKTV